MRHRTPLVTLAAVAVLFAALLTADFVVHPGPAHEVPGPALITGYAGTLPAEPAEAAGASR